MKLVAGEWVADEAGCGVLLSLDGAAAHEAACPLAVALCDFAGCGAPLRRRDVAAHNAASAVAHAFGEQAARLYYEALWKDATAKLAETASRLAESNARLAAAPPVAARSDATVGEHNYQISEADHAAAQQAAIASAIAHQEWQQRARQQQRQRRAQALRTQQALPGGGGSGQQGGPTARPRLPASPPGAAAARLHTQGTARNGRGSGFDGGTFYRLPPVVPSSGVALSPGAADAAVQRDAPSSVQQSFLTWVLSSFGVAPPLPRR